MRLSFFCCYSWVSAVGLEIHAQISSQTKIFSESTTRTNDASPNSCVSLFDIAIPGTLPVLNISCVKAGVLTALALNANINIRSYFDRKHYFYPDLPAGYQITQKRVPLAVGGSLDVPHNDSLMTVKLRQLHLEQDSGKIVFGEKKEEGQRETLVDYNRAGVGLMEIVTDPDMRNGAEAAAFVRELRLLLRQLGTCDGNMQDGSLRIDANISVTSDDRSITGARTEVKNISGLKFLTKAIDYEILRHIKVLENGGQIEEETRSFDERKSVTTPTRGKSLRQDYRFMAEHDLPPLILYSKEHPPPNGDTPIINIDDVANELPELPSQLRSRLSNMYSLSLEQIQTLLNEEGAVEFFEDVIKRSPGVPVKTIYSWITSELYGVLEAKKVGVVSSPVSTDQLVSLTSLVHDRMITGPLAKQILKLMADGDTRLATPIINELGLVDITEDELNKLCIEVIEEHPEQVSLYVSGKYQVIGYLIGEVMKRTQHKGDPKTIKHLLIREIERATNQ